MYAVRVNCAREIEFHQNCEHKMQAVVTPLSQALSEGNLTREELRELMERSNGPALKWLAGWVAVVLTTGSLVVFAWNSWLIWPTMFLHGIVIVHHFSLQHECVHYSVFRTRWLNKLVGTICGYIIVLPNRFFRYEHCDHHTYTQLHGKDPELIPMPKNITEYLLFLSSIPFWYARVNELLRHTLGHLNDQAQRFIPPVDQSSIIHEPRFMLMSYLVVVLLMYTTGWWAPLWLWIIPLILGEPVMRFIRMTEHVGRPTVAQRQENTRTNLVSWPWRFLCWNMNFHAEHHYASSVPFHALPDLHEKIKKHIYIEPAGYLGAHRDILARLRKGPSSTYAKG